MYESQLKPLIDFLVAFTALIIFSPLFLVIAIMLTLSNKGTPFFLQKRPGKDGKIFNIIKFKTMRDQKMVDGRMLTDYERLTFVGKAVR